MLVDCGLFMEGCSYDQLGSAADPPQVAYRDGQHKLLELSQNQRMNTNIQRNIFCTIMTNERFLDMFEKLLKLGLKDYQDREIIHVLVDCCLW